MKAFLIDICRVIENDTTLLHCRLPVIVLNQV
jgi:hypothetical protein